MSGIITKIEGRWFIANRFGEANLICEEKNPSKTSKCSAQNRRVEVTTEYVK